jgi:hypothetical protein
VRRLAQGTRKDGGSDTEHVYARAVVESVSVTEHYNYEQEISRNPAHRMTSVPTGRIELTTPYDGQDYFTRQAQADVLRQLPGSTATSAVIGHLVFADYHKTDLDEVLDLAGGYGSMPIAVPIHGLPDDAFISDSYLCRIDHDYAPDRDMPKTIPVHVDVELFDPDGVGLYDMFTGGKPGEDLVGKVAKEITQQVGFRSYLFLKMQVVLHVPNSRKAAGLKPRVARVSLNWPTITSLSALKVVVVGEGEIPLEYNPTTRSIEWSDVDMVLDRQAADDDGNLHGDTLTFVSKQMLLRIDQPGELYKRQSLGGVVDVEVPDHLLSGVKTRLFNAIGTQPKQKPAMTSHVRTDLRLILDDAFARRQMMPYQHLYFDEVIPDPMRIADIVTALHGKGFEVEEHLDSAMGGDFERHLLIATRQAGPDVMQLWLLIEGRRYETERQKEMPGGHMYKSNFGSGDLKIFMCGALPGTSRDLTHVMNALQQALRERFERIKDRR